MLKGKNIREQTSAENRFSVWFVDAPWFLFFHDLFC